MSRLAVSIVIPVWNQWEYTRACLESIRPTLGVHDEVIVIDNGSEDGTALGLKQFPWVRVITNETNLGFAVACNQGAAAAERDVIIFHNNDTLVPSHWIEGLVEPFAESDVFATGPRSNFVSGPQLVLNPDYEFGSNASLKRFAKKWRETHRGQTTEIDRLVGFCLAVRTSAFRAIDGFDEEYGTGGGEDDDLCLRLIDHGGRLLICHDTFIHHFGHVTFDGNGLQWFDIQQQNTRRLFAKHDNVSIHTPRPTDMTQRTDAVARGTVLLSAAMIVKDEIANLERCLDSLSGVVDEVVIYDTGSTDGSIELATKAGAKVIKGTWDDDFARARNAALDECSGDWILSIDADEEFTGDAIELRTFLQQSPVGALQVPVLNLAETERDTIMHRPCRLFRKHQFAWSGRLHEQVTPRDHSAHIDSIVAEHIEIRHYGYLKEHIAAKNKIERNIRIAELEASETDGRFDMVDKITNLGRSHIMAGNFDEALSLFERARQYESPHQTVWRTLYRAGAQTCLSLNRFDDVLRWADDLATVSTAHTNVHIYKANAYFGLGEYENVLDELANITESMDDDGVYLSMSLVHLRRAAALAMLERWEESADEFALALEEDAVDDAHWPMLIETYYHTGRDINALCDSISDENVNHILGNLTGARPEAADALLEQLYEDDARRSNALALAIRIAPLLPNDRALEWSLRLRVHNLVQHCPLVARAWNSEVEVYERLRAIAYLNSAFGDTSANEAMRFVAGDIDDADFASIIVELNEIAPQLLEPFITHAASTPARGLALARVLAAFEAIDEAVAVVQYAFDKASETHQPVTNTIADEAASWLTTHGAEDIAMNVRQLANAQPGTHEDPKATR